MSEIGVETTKRLRSVGVSVPNGGYDGGVLTQDVIHVRAVGGWAGGARSPPGETAGALGTERHNGVTLPIFKEAVVAA